MIEKLNEAKALIDEGKYEEAKAKIDEVIAANQNEASTLSDGGKRPIGGGGTGFPHK